MAGQSSSGGGSEIANAQLIKVIAIGTLALAGAGLVYFGILRPIMCKVGIVECKAGKEQDQLILENFDNKGFDPEYWRTKTPSMSWERARVLAEKAYKAGGIFNDNESALYSVLQEAGSYANLSLIAYVFKNKYSESLAEWYGYYLSDISEQQKIKAILQEYK